MSKDAGRPKKDLTKDTVFKVRMNVGEKAILDYLSEIKGINRSEVIRKALKKYYETEKNN